MSKKIPVIAIVGRPNVGKSTLFNRILGEQRAIVEDMPGVTRDRNYALVERFAIPFMVVDTGGIDPSEDVLAKYIKEQAMIAADEADLVLCMFDANMGVHPDDHDVVGLLRKMKKRAVFIANKCDGREQSAKALDFYNLGIDEILDISALHGHGVTPMIAEVLRSLPDYEALETSENSRREHAQKQIDLAEAAFVDDYDVEEEEEPEDEYDDGDVAPKELPPEAWAEPIFAPVFMPDDSEEGADNYEKTYGVREISARSTSPQTDDSDLGDDEDEESSEPDITDIRLALIGRPNVGKSTLLNTLTGERRAITSPLAGTTRDSIDITITREGKRFTIVDTAGVRKQGRVEGNLERAMVLRSLRVLSDCDVAVIVFDAQEGPLEQDVKLAGLAHEQGRGLVFVINKWDLVEKDHRTVKEFRDKMREALKFAPYAPIVFISALSGRRCPRVLSEALRVARERLRRIPTNKLNKVLKRGMSRHQAPVYRGRPVRLYYATQVDVAPPRFALFFNYPKAVHFSYLRYLKNELRSEFGFDGTDLKLMTKKRGKSDGE